jgi:hypothetical protein
LRLSAFRLRIFFRSSVLSFVIAGLDPAIHAEASLAQALPPAFGRVASAWTTGSKSGGDESESAVTVAWHSSGAKARRENGIAYL